jgi:hypothetical protein
MDVVLNAATHKTFGRDVRNDAKTACQHLISVSSLSPVDVELDELTVDKSMLARKRIPKWGASIAAHANIEDNAMWR